MYITAKPGVCNLFFWNLIKTFASLYGIVATFQKRYWIWNFIDHQHIRD